MTRVFDGLNVSQFARDERDCLKGRNDVSCQRWNQPHFMCAFCPFVQVLTVNVSVFTFTAIAVDRHRDILNPLSARPSKLRAKISIACIWCVAGILAVPMAIALRVAIVE
ncbi:neuropeptide Y receptor activity protein [Homalodisca vitripennis]|nr:neuropeptide Y receptor activity protein [Homalodisca vitripennis]